MCGIIGWKSNTQRVNENIIRKMADAIAHRGPDGEGFYYSNDGSLCLAHKRLAIIDPENGHQPMKSLDEELVITFNGAIYNFLELRRELVSLGHPIKSYSDTEVLIYAYKQWGEKCLDRLNGMFSFVIHDKRKKILFGARDRLGEKPFYYFYNKKEFVFASEIKAILASGVVKASLNNESLHEYLTFQYYLDNNTLFENIIKLKPGHCFVLDEVSMNLEVKEYWDVVYTKTVEEHSEDYYIDKLRHLIDDSIALRMRADVPLGSHLSGGIDSSAVAALNALHLGDSLKLETLDFLKKE